MTLDKTTFSDSKLAEMIAWYATFEFYVFPVHGIKDGRCTCGKPFHIEKGQLDYREGDCENPGKHPVTRNGLKDAIHAGASEEVAALFNYNTDYNIAIRTGTESGMFVVDVDGEIGNATLTALEQTYGLMPPTLTFLTGKGKHIVFTHPGIKVKTARDVWGSKIDCRGDGGYIVAPPSNHASGRQYKVDDGNPHRISVAPSWLLTSMSAERSRAAKTLDAASSSGATPEWSQDEVWRMLDVLDPSCGYDDWIAVGMGLHDGGFGYGMWDQWSAGSFKYKSGCCVPHWRSYTRNGGISMGTLVDMAKRRGWHPENTYRERLVDDSKIRGFIANAGKKPAAQIAETLDDIPFDMPAPPLPAQLPVASPQIAAPQIAAGSFGFDPVKLPGLIGETIRWIEKHALFSQPELALFNVLTFAGAVFGRRYASPMNTRTNLYMVGIASTGSGKDHSRKLITLLAAHSGLSQFIGANNFRSDSGLAQSLSQNSSQLMMIDEFGLLLKSLSDERSGSHQKMIARMMMELYSSSGSAYNHGTYADPRIKPIVVIDPNLCVYGVSTETMYAAALRKTAIESGDINRFIVAKSAVEYPSPQFGVPILHTPQSLIDAWAEFKPSDLGSMVNSSNIKPRIVTIGWGACERIQQDLLIEQCERRTGTFGSLWVRLYENTIKIAMVLAISRSRLDPVFYPEDFACAAGIVRNAIRYMEGLTREHMADSETEEQHLEVIRRIREAGGRMGKAELMRSMRRLKKREFNDLIDSMIDGEVIDVELTPRPGGGRGLTEYVLKKSQLTQSEL